MRYTITIDVDADADGFVDFGGRFIEALQGIPDVKAVSVVELQVSDDPVAS